MRTPAGGDRSTQWVIQHRTPPDEETLVGPWTRFPLMSAYTPTATSARSVLDKLRAEQPELEWRVVRVEIVQRVEGW